MDWFRNFIRRSGVAGLLITVSVVTWVLMVILAQALKGDFAAFMNQLLVPMDVQQFIRQPWSILTYWAVTPPSLIFLVITEAIVLYSFGHILNAMIGDRRMNGIVIAGIVFNALGALLLSNISPLIEVSDRLYLYSLIPLNVTLIAATITLVPNYNWQIIRWNVRLLWVGLALIGIHFLSFGIIKALMGTTVIFSALLGFVIMKVIQSGWNPMGWWADRRGSPAPRSSEPPRVREKVAKTRIKVVHSARQSPEISPEEELDLLLDKISEKGLQSLSAREKQRLDELSGGPGAS